MKKSALIASLDTFTKAYIDCALWSSLDNTTESGGYPLDDNYSEYDLTVKALRSMIADCQAFQAENKEDLSSLDDSQCGHDFWLSRNGHGAGFWDRGNGLLGDRLHQATKPYGSVDLYLFKGKIHST